MTCRIVIATILLLFLPLHGAGQFFDQGLQNPSPPIRSDYPSPTKGTSSNPIAVDSQCLFGPRPTWDGQNEDYSDIYFVDGQGKRHRRISSCPEQHLGTFMSFNQANWWSLNGGGSAAHHWIAHFNVEHWWMSNSGPPPQSLPRSPSGQGVFGLEAGVLVGGETFPRIHMNLRADLFNPADNDRTDPIPFMSIGAEANHGNGGPVGWMHWHPHLGVATPEVEFTSKLWCSQGTRFRNHFVYFRTEWGGIPRFAFVALYGSEHGAQWWPESGEHGTSLGARQAWSWPIQESFFYPGADMATTNVVTLANSCPDAVLGYNQLLQWGGGSCAGESSRDERTYRFNVQRIFQCLANAGSYTSGFPIGQWIPILGIHWGNEAGGGSAPIDARLWTSVHGMRMDPAF